MTCDLENVSCISNCNDDDDSPEGFDPTCQSNCNGDGEFDPGLDGLLGTEDDICISNCNNNDDSPEGFDPTCQSNCNDDDGDIDGDGIINEYDPYPDGIDLGCQSDCNSIDPNSPLYDQDIDNDGIYDSGPDGIINTEDDICIANCNDTDPNNPLYDQDVDGDGILNQYDPFPYGNFETATICFEYPGFDFNIVSEIQPDLCNDDNYDGNTITIDVDGSPSNFTFTWFNANGLEVSNTQNLENVAPGSYTLLTTHNDGCELWSEFVINTPEPLSVDNIDPSEFNGYNVPCPNNSDDNQCGGTITLDITGGIPFNDENDNDNIDDLIIVDENSYYKYVINNGNISTTPVALESNSFNDNIINVTIENICEGNNTITIIGQFDCVITFEVLMTGPDEFIINAISEDVSCPNAEDGSIEIECFGGVPPYSYEWFLNGELIDNTQNINNLSGGEYFLYVTDENNCIYSEFITIQEAPDFNIEVMDNPPICSSVVGQVAFDVSGGHPGNYQYSIISSDGLIDNNTLYDYNVLDSLSFTAGIYEFVFIDSKGCKSDSILVDLNELSEDCLQIPSLFSPNGDGQNDIWQIGGIENYPTAKIDIYNRWGQLVFSANGNYFGNEWDGTHNGTPLPFAVYYYVIDPVNENIKTYHGGVTIKR